MFKKYFEVFVCDTEESKKIHHHIRWRVYCEELGYEDVEAFPDKLEKDEYDEFSDLFIVRYRKTGEYIAAFRLIHSNKVTLPLTKLCEMDEPIEPNSREMSRVCILNNFRTTNLSVGDDKNIQNSVFHGIAEAAGEYCFNRLTKYCYWIIRPGLAKLLSRAGLDMKSAGKPCEHRGTRYPYKTEILKLMGYYTGSFFKCDRYRYFSHLSIEEINNV